MATKKTAKKTVAPRKSKASQAKGKLADEPHGECPRGGDHEWTTDDGASHCGKCHQPAPLQKGKGKGTSPRKGKVTKEAEPDTGTKLSALDAAAQVLAETQLPMNCQELIEAMAAKGLWTSPGGKTPAQTLYSAISREIARKGNASRFAKADRGKFAANA